MFDNFQNCNLKGLNGNEDRLKAILHQDLMTMRDAIDYYHSDKGTYPESLE